MINTRQKAEWLGDGLLNFYVKAKLLEKFPDASMKELSDMFSKIISNKHLNMFAGKQSWRGSDHVEEEIFLFAQNEGIEGAEKLIDRIIDFYFGKMYGRYPVVYKRLPQ